jgi:hypothetical protein
VAVLDIKSSLYKCLVVCDYAGDCLFWQVKLGVMKELWQQVLFFKLLSWMERRSKGGPDYIVQFTGKYSSQQPL